MATEALESNCWAQSAEAATSSNTAASPVRTQPEHVLSPQYILKSHVYIHIYAFPDMHDSCVGER